MKALHNKINGKVLKSAILADTTKRITLSFYKYSNITNPGFFRDHFYTLMDSVGVLGRIYVAKEGVNAQISVPEQNFEAFKSKMDEVDFLKNIRLNIAVEDNGKSFFKLKVLNRYKILADGVDDSTFDSSDMGRHLSAKEWNELSEQPGAILVDMRNHYETEIGHFENAICPDVDTFKECLKVVTEEIADKKENPVLMYCTGGIRCEKASAWLKHNGFKHVFQLEGGIIKYAHQVQEQGLENHFKGVNFVFDERMGEVVSEDIISNCHQCGKPSYTHVNCANKGCHLLFIQCDSCQSEYNGCCSAECKHIISLSEEEQKSLRKGNSMPNQHFKKGRWKDKLVNLA